ncbi:MAG: hypothetical protein ACK50J_26225, partial [Planctomyces sp.]
MLFGSADHGSALSEEVVNYLRTSGEAGTCTTEQRTRRRLVLTDSGGVSVEDYINAADSLNADERFRSGSTHGCLITETELRSCDVSSAPEEIVVFMEGSVTPRALRLMSLVRTLGQGNRTQCVVVITSLQRHLTENPDQTLEQTLLFQLKPCLSALTVIRTGMILSPNSSVTRSARRFGATLPLISPALSGTFLTIESLVAIIETEMQLQQLQDNCTPLTDSSGVRTLTVPGSRRLLRDVVSEVTSPPENVSSRIVQFAFQAAAAIGVRWMIAESLRFLAKISTSCRKLTSDTLHPQSVEELRQLCNRHSTDQIQIAGCNNGVRHFGWKFPSKTVVLTTRMPGRAELLDDPPGVSFETLSFTASVTPNVGKPVRRFRVDAGLTLKYCIDELARSGYEFFVVPNYSYISMGTLFFVPIHGSGSRVSTLGDTIEEVTLWNRCTEQHATARRGDELFRQVMYSPSGHWVVLSLTLAVRGRTRYTVHCESLHHSTADDILEILNDTEASNVEIRRHSASSTSIDVSRYYAE